MAATSGYGTKRTWCDVRSESAFRGKAEVRLTGRQVSFGPLTDLGSSPCHTVVDLAAKRAKIDRFGQNRLGAALQGLSPGIGRRHRR